LIISVWWLIQRYKNSNKKITIIENPPTTEPIPMSPTTQI
jgi:hypothetical protein